MIDFLKQTFREFSRDNCLQIAAALSYYAIFSLPPLLVIVISAAGFVVDREDMRQRVNTEFRSVIGASGAKQIDTMIGHAQLPGRGFWGTIVGLAVLLVGATGVMVQLQSSLNQVWNVKPDPQQGGVLRFLWKRLLSLGMIMAVAFLMLISLVLTMILRSVQEYASAWLPAGVSAGSLELGHAVISYLLITGLFAVMYKYLPDARIDWSDVAVGAAITGLLFVIAKWGLGWYLGHSDISSAYGAAGTLALILVWIYYSGLIFLFGAELTQVWARRTGKGISPEPGAVRADAKPA